MDEAVQAMRSFGHALGVTCSNMAASSSISCRFGPRARFCTTLLGRRVLDFTSGQMSAILGHSHPEIVATVRDGVGRLDHLFSSMLSEPVVELAEALAGLVPRPAEGDAAVHRRRGERGGDPAGEAGHRQVGGRRLRAVLARHDRRRGGGHLQGRAARHRPMAPGCFAIPAPNAYRPRFRRRRAGSEELDDAFDCSTGRAPAISPRSSPSRS